MNILDPALRELTATEPGERLFLDGNGPFAQRTAAVAAVAAAEAGDVDRNARFPKAAIDAARQQKLLGHRFRPGSAAMVPRSLNSPTCATRSAAPARRPP